MNYSDEIYYSLLPVLIISFYVIICFNYFALTWHRRPKTDELVSRLHNSFLGIFFREFWIWITDPIVRVFKFFKITPNTITMASLVLSFGVAALYFYGSVHLAGWLLMLGGSLDFMDGRIARETGQATKAGSYLDSCIDRYSDGIVFAGVALYFLGKNFSLSSASFTVENIDFIMAIFSISAILGSEIMSYVKARGEIMGFSTRRGMMQREERVVMLAFFSVVDQFFRIIAVQYGWYPDAMFVTLIVVMSVLINFSAAIRFFTIFRLIKKSESA